MNGMLLICKKEFQDLSKDKRTLFFTFLLPVLLYPTIFLLMASLDRSDAAERQRTASRISIVDTAGVLRPVLEQEPKLFELVGDGTREIQPALRNRELDLGLEISPDAARQIERQEPYTIRVLMDESEPSSVLALERVKNAVQAMDSRLVAQRLEMLHAPPHMIRPSHLAVENVADPGSKVGKALGSFLPYLLMLMLFQGAMQHGIHTTAGEKERGTLQSLLATRLTRNRIIWGKLIFIFCMGLTSALLNLLSLGISLSVVMGQILATPGSLPTTPGAMSAMTSPMSLLLSFVQLVPLGMMFSSFILYMGFRAKSVAEAGTSLVPGVFVILAMGAISSAPGLERMSLLPYVPILNVSLAIRKLFGGQADALEYLIALLMTTGLSILMTWASTRLLNRESVIFSSG